MKYTFHSDDCMIITIPLGSLRNAKGDGNLMPDKFTCVFKDVYKVFLKGRPKALGTAQLITGIFILCLGAVHLTNFGGAAAAHIVPSVVFIGCGIMTYAAGHSPLMPVMKMSFVFNIIGLFWALAACVICLLTLKEYDPPVTRTYGPTHSPVQRAHMNMGIKSVLTALYVLQFLLAAVMIFWESKAVCRVHFNTLPMITLKQDS